MSPMLALLSDLTVSIVRIKLEAAEIIKQSLLNLIVSVIEKLVCLVTINVKQLTDLINM